MTDEQLWDIVQKQVENRIGSLLKVLSYAEIQIDIISQLVVDLSKIVDTEKITPDVQIKLDSLEQILKYSAIDFSNLSSIRENYKIPMSVALKSIMRNIQKPYLDIVLGQEGWYQINMDFKVVREF